MKKIKLLIVVITLALFNGNLYAQNSDCKGDLSVFAENVKMKNYEAAYTPWRHVYDSCPNLNKATFVYADKILRHKIKTTKDDEKKKYIDLLMSCYEKGHSCFSKKITYADIYMSKALLMHDFKLTDKEGIYQTLDKGFKKDKDNFDNPKAIYLYFSSLVDLYKSGKYDLQKVFDTYDILNEAIEYNKEMTIKKSEKLSKKDESGTLSPREKKIQKRLIKKVIVYDKISNSMDNKLGQLADCKNLIPLYTKNFKSKKDDEVWLKRAAARMDEKNCTDNTLFIKITEQLHRLSPSASSAYYVGLLKDKKGQRREAIKFYNESVNLEKDNYRKSKILLKIASKYKKSKQNKIAYSYAVKAIAARSSYGNAYLFIASIYASSANECGSTQFEKRAIYWKAEKMAIKAGKAQPSMAKQAKKAAYSYKQRAPQKSDIFQSGLAGKTISLSCWIGGTIRVPNL